ncbi:MAG: hypothetical protein AAF802_29730 [Planctomycetota bacterium]
MRFLTVALLLVVFVGCKHKGAISPHREVITEPTTPSFDCEGVWSPEPDVPFPQGLEQLVTIREVEDGVFSLHLSNSDEVEFEVRTTSLGEHDQYAIAEMHASIQGESWLRYIGIVQCTDDKLTAWWIESKDLARLMHADGHSAVIERGAFGTKVFAESGDLLDCITKHSRELIGKPQSFTRKAE